MPKSKKAPQLPDTVYVFRDGFLVTKTSLQELPEDTEIGVYELVDTLTLRVTRELVKG